MARRLAPFDGTGERNRPAEQQQFFGEGGFARVGVGDDGEGTAVAVVVGEDVAHGVSAVKRGADFSAIIGRSGDFYAMAVRSFGGADALFAYGGNVDVNGCCLGF